MKLVSRKIGLILRLGVLATALLFGQQAMAVGTRADTLVLNTATVDFQVAGVDQSQLSATAEFVVDRRVNFTLAPLGGALVEVTPGGTFPTEDYFFDFLLTNTSNSVIDFNVALTQMVGGLVRLPAQNDNANMFAVAYAVSTLPLSAPGPIPDPIRTDPQYVDELEADDSIRIRVFGDAALAMTNGQIAGVNLNVVGAVGDDPGTEGIALDDTAADTPLGVENVFADDLGDNSESAQDGFIVVSADLDVSKDYIWVSDVLTSGLPIPGAIIQYTITIVNPSLVTDADTVQIGDVLDANLTFVTGGFLGGNDFEINNDGTVTQCTAVPDIDDCEAVAGVITIDGISVAADTTLTLSYQVQILDPATTPVP